MKTRPVREIASRRSIAPAIGLLVAAIATGCGGGGDGAGDEAQLGTSSLSRPEYNKRANAICVRYHERVDRAIQDGAGSQEGQSAGGGLRPARLARIMESTGIPAGHAEARALRALGAPPVVRSEVEAMLVAFENWIEEAERAVGESLEGKTSKDTKTSTAQLFPEHYKAAELAQKLGLDKDCAVL